MTSPLSVHLAWEKEITQQDLDTRRGLGLPKDLGFLQRRLERLYLELPWPEHFKHVTLFTEIKGGRGDVAAGAKVINLMHKLLPTLRFDWILQKKQSYDETLYLDEKVRPSVRVRLYAECNSSLTVDTDLFIEGPASSQWRDVEVSLGLNLKGPRYQFNEIADWRYDEFRVISAHNSIKKGREAGEDEESIYRRAHHIALFSTDITMGLNPGLGVFIDQGRLDAPLSRRYCCPSYLLELESSDLRADILQVVGEDPDYDSYSVNCGYAHHAHSWKNFIECVAIAERDKHVLIVLNQHGEMYQYPTDCFFGAVLADERVAFLRRLGYGRITVKGEGQPLCLSGGCLPDSRTLTIIVRPSFLPQDMARLQLASERILATGDNTACEAWAARCKMFCYEDIGNGFKVAFLHHQKKLAETISKPLFRLLQLFGDKQTWRGDTLTEAERKEIAEITQGSALEEATQRFCEIITKEYDFRDALIGAVKRAVWVHAHPELLEVESEALDEEFKTGLIRFLSDATTPPQTIEVKNLSLLAERVRIITSS